MSNATATNVLEFSETKTFRAIAWNGKINGECSTVPFRRSATNPDPSKFEEITEGEMKSARGTRATRLSIEGGVENWGWL